MRPQKTKIDLKKNDFLLDTNKNLQKKFFFAHNKHYLQNSSQAFNSSPC